MQKQNPLLCVWGRGKDEHGRLIGAVISALIAVVLGMLPYFAAAQVIIGMLEGQKDLSFYLPWLGLGLAGYAVRTVLYNMALSVSHKATFSILKTIRQKILEKLPKLPLGTVMDMQSGKMKQIIVDQVDGMETTLAHLFPELTANIAGPVMIIIYLFILDWRMALLSLVTIPVGMAFIAQDNYLFETNVRENIRMGKLSATDKDVETAAKAAGCDAFIRSLEKGYETNVGGGGAHLSGGERQRIAIARAMLKDAPIVILDEATANVDPENEDRLQKAIEELTRDKTIIMIAHRLKTVRNADQILVVDEGRIVQKGKHEELIGQEGIYADFVLGRKEAIGWKLQAQ